MKFTKIDEALDWIMSKRRNGVEFEKFKQTVEDMGHPESKLKMIHVAGTNGKGSVVAYLRDALKAMGYKVGTLQSPHYKTHLDRIRINNQNIPDETFLRLLNKNLDFFISKDLNMFEMDYLIMVEYFLEEEVDFAIVEVGMGGRFDSTNVVINPLLSIIVTIGFDHMKELGDTLEKICFEKCGIIKDNSAVLVGNLDDNLKDITKGIAEDHHSKYLEIKSYKEIDEHHFSYDGNIYELGSIAKYQRHNASIALEAINYLKDQGYISYDYQKVRDGIAKSIWEGRFEIISKEPLIIFDGAHNMPGIKAFIESFKEIKMPKGILFSAIKTKEYLKMVAMLKDECDELVMTDFIHPLLIDTKNTAQELNVRYMSNNEEALAYLKNKYACVAVCGSLYFLSEMIMKVEKNEG